MQIFFIYSESSRKTLSESVFNSKIFKWPDFDKITHLCMVHGFFLKLAYFWSRVFITSFERARFKLLEKHKISENRHSKQKLWPF